MFELDQGKLGGEKMYRMVGRGNVIGKGEEGGEGEKKKRGGR